ncbi:MAG: transposase [Spirochaetota bacterium]|jgi:transposase
MTPWTLRYLEWIKKEVTFEEEALQWTLEEYMNEVEHCSLRITRLDGLIDKAVENAPEAMREVVAALQALRGIGKVTAVTIVAEVGQLSRFPTARQSMGYIGTVPSEHSSGETTYSTNHY